MNVHSLLLLAALSVPLQFSFPTDHLFSQDQKLPAYNVKSEKIMKHVSHQAVEHANIPIESTMTPPVDPTGTPFPTVTLEPEPTQLMPHDPPPCPPYHWEESMNEGNDMAIRTYMPCPMLDK
jgi:hypothetical protein